MAEMNTNWAVAMTKITTKPYSTYGDQVDALADEVAGFQPGVAKNRRLGIVPEGAGQVYHEANKQYPYEVKDALHDMLRIALLEQKGIEFGSEKTSEKTKAIGRLSMAIYNDRDVIRSFPKDGDIR